MSDQIMGVVNTRAEAKVGTTYRGEEVIEVRGIYEPDPKSASATVIVLSKKAAINLASQLFGIILDNKEWK